jgi:hypothetical protein
VETNRLNATTDADSEEEPTKAQIIQILRDTVPFGQSYNLEIELDRRVPFEKFNTRVGIGFKHQYPDKPLPSIRTLQRLRQRVIDAHVARSWLISVKRIAASADYKSYRKWLDNVIAVGGELKALLNRPERLLPPRYAQPGKVVAASLSQLHTQLFNLERYEQRLDGMKRGSNWNESLRRARMRMDEILKADCPQLNGIQRADLIKLAEEAVHLKVEDTTEAIERQLRRVRAGAAPPTAKRRRK